MRFLRGSLPPTALLLVLVLGCGGGVDERDEVRNAYGEPDRVEQLGGGALWFETWYYDDYYQENIGLGFNFRRGAPKCGGERDYYLYSQFDYRISDSTMVVISETLYYYSKASPVGKDSPLGP